MMAWVKEGNEIEPQYTVEELAEKENQEAANALESQKTTCVKYLNESEMHVSADPPYPDDSQLWKNVRKQWRLIIKSDKIQEIPPKPFS